MKQQILQIIFDIFHRWNSELEVSCKRGCSSCCTQNVTITAVEAELILRFVMENGMSSWLADKLHKANGHQPPKMTSNDFASACLEGKEVTPGEHPNLASCPFLENEICRIYPARPFGCRLFISTARCSTSQPAQMPDHYFEGATAVSQLLEHLGQKEYWGNMLDVLPALLDIGEFREIADQLNSTMIIQARMKTLTAKPLPGFLISEEQSEKVFPLLNSIFDARIGDKRVEDILNGK